MAVTKRLRYEILRRDNHACRYCGAVAPDVELTIDHVVPVSLGGSDDPSNLVTACRPCNSGKSSATADSALVADVEEDALRWAAAKKRAVEMVHIERDVRQDVEQAIWDVFEEYKVPSYRGGGTLAGWLPGDWFASIEQFMLQGLDKTALIEAAYIAAEAPGVRADNIWRYFCGVCWRKVGQLEGVAQELMTEPSPPPTEPPAEVRYATYQFFALASVCDGVAA